MFFKSSSLTFLTLKERKKKEMIEQREFSAQLITSSKVHTKTLNQIVKETKLRLQQTPESKLLLHFPLN